MLRYTAAAEHPRVNCAVSGERPGLEVRFCGRRGFVLINRVVYFFLFFFPRPTRRHAKRREEFEPAIGAILIGAYLCWPFCRRFDAWPLTGVEPRRTDGGGAFASRRVFVAPGSYRHISRVSNTLRREKIRAKNEIKGGKGEKWTRGGMEGKEKNVLVGQSKNF